MTNLVKSLEKTLNWEAEKHPIYRGDGKIIKGWAEIRRDDNHEVLNICKASYNIEPNQTLVENANLLAEKTGFNLEGFDTFQGGRKVLAFLKNPDMNGVGGNNMQDYLLIGNSHDYSSSFWIGNTSVMLRCSNQFTYSNKQFTVRHTANNQERIDQLIRGFERYMEQNEKLYLNFNRLLNTEIQSNTIEEVVNRVVGISSKENPSTRKLNIKNDIVSSVHRECFDLGRNAWGLFNGFTHYTSHVKKAKEKTYGNALGSVADLNEQAYFQCLSLCEN
jgi:hypothetical protein